MNIETMQKSKKVLQAFTRVSGAYYIYNNLMAGQMLSPHFFRVISNLKKRRTNHTLVCFVIRFFELIQCFLSLSD